MNIRKALLVTGTTFGILSAAIAAKSQAAESETSTLSSQSLGGGEFQYNIALTNTSTTNTNIGTFWFGWVPGADFMDVNPTSITLPAGWTDNITHTGATDGYAIQWLAGASPLTPGNTDSFSFDSTDTLAQLLGPSPFAQHQTETTSFIYSGAPFSDAGVQFTVVPEPATLGLLTAGAFGLLMRRRKHA
jgi:hypothetical protein